MKSDFCQKLAIQIACVLLLSSTPLLAQSDATVGATLIQPNDKLTIDVYKNPDLSRQVTVQPDGLISISLVQSIQAAGLTPAQLKAELEKRLKEYLEVPTVTVIIDAIQSYRVYVTGKVQKPGVIISERPITVLQALSLAGGFQEYAKKDQITIVRTISPQVGRGQQDIKYPFDHDRVIDGSKQAQNIFLLSGDVSMFRRPERFLHIPKVRFTFQMIAIAFITAYSSTLLGGQGKYNVGVTADITAGGNGPTLPGINSAQTSDSFAPFLGTYPSVAFNARGEHSTLNSTYGFGFDQNYTNPKYETKSHSATVGFSSKLGPKWSFNLADTFYKTSNISSYRLLSGVTTVPDQAALEQFQFAFTPVFHQSNQSNTATIGLDRTFNKKSSFAISGSYATLDYPDSPQTTGVLSDQKRISAVATYKRSGEHYSWSLGYSGARFNFAAFQNSMSHSGVFGYSYQFSPKLSIQFNIGPSYLDSLENTKSPVGTNVTASLTRVIPKGSFAVTASQASGDTSGLGSVSRNREARLDMSHSLGKSTKLSANVSGFNTEGLQLNGLSARGIAAGGNLGFALSRDWSLNCGGQYQHYEGYNTPGYDQKRVFLSLRYSKPELWRF